jgi:hypothetical protein
VTGSYEHGNDVSVSIKGEKFLGHLKENYFPQNAISFHCAVSNSPICRMEWKRFRRPWRFNRGTIQAFTLETGQP